MNKVAEWVNSFFSKPPYQKIENLVPVPEMSSWLSTSVLYIGNDNDEHIVALLDEKYDKISDFLKNVQCEFIFYPALFNKNSWEDWHNITNVLSYHFPAWHAKSGMLEDKIKTINARTFYSLVSQAYNIENKATPLFLFVEPHKVSVYSIGKNESLKSEVTGILNLIINNLSEQINSRHSLSLYDHKLTQDPTNAEEAFEDEATKISMEVSRKIEYLVLRGQSQAIFNIFNTLVKQAKLHKPQLLKEFNKISIAEIDTALSRIVVGPDFRIILPDYDNLEIEMTPLPKALYLFFLKHPEGVMLHDLVDHKKELLSIYGNITNSSSTREIRKRIDDMTDISNNSINEKCSRIKEAFVLKIAEGLAQNYYITGSRGEVKRISLPKELILFNV